jgi:hypothetical protein
MDMYDSSGGGGWTSFSSELYMPAMALGNRFYLSHRRALILEGMLDRCRAAARGRINAGYRHLLDGI